MQTLLKRRSSRAWIFSAVCRRVMLALQARIRGTLLTSLAGTGRGLVLNASFGKSEGAMGCTRNTATPWALGSSRI